MTDEIQYDFFEKVLEHIELIEAEIYEHNRQTQVQLEMLIAENARQTRRRRGQIKRLRRWLEGLRLDMQLDEMAFDDEEDVERRERVRHLGAEKTHSSEARCHSVPWAQITDVT